MKSAIRNRMLCVVLAGFSLGTGSVFAEILPDPGVTEYEPSEVAAELDQFEAVGDGIVLTLAACEEEPHCVTAMSTHELARLIDRIQRRIEHLEQRRDEDGRLDEPYGRFLERYRTLHDRYAEYLRQVRIVALRIDEDSLEQAWEDLLDFGFVEPEPEAGPDVPSPNDQITLQRFEDADEPMPID